VARTIVVPELDVLGDFATAAAHNSRRLLEDAELLASRGRYSTAYSTAVLAFEEAGKAWLTVIAMMAPDSLRAEFPFRQLITAHQDKLLAAHALARMLWRMRNGQPIYMGMLSDGDLPELAREHDRAKQRGFYADVADEVIWDPASISKDEARQMIATVRRVLDEGGMLADPEFIAFAVSGPPDFRSVMEAMFGVLLKGIEDGPEKMAAALQEFMNQLGATPDELRKMMLEEDARRTASARHAIPQRAQPRRLPRGKRRQR
jgi:AbiV family abortive infection protein